MKYLKTFMALKLFRHQKIIYYLAPFVHSSHTYQIHNFAPNFPPSSVAYEKRKTKFSNILSDFGFSNGQVKHILFVPHLILELDEKDFLSNLLNWTTFDANDKIFTVLTGNPELLTLDPVFVQNRVKELMTIFTRKDINKLLITCPQVFLDDFQSVMEKVQYIVHKMKVEQKSIVKSHALQFSLDHIKCRHVFMLNAGIYKIEKKSTKNRNPPLHKIFSRNIDQFLKLTPLTEEEFLVFCDGFNEGAFEFPEDFDDEEDFSDDEC